MEPIFTPDSAHLSADGVNQSILWHGCSDAVIQVTWLWLVDVYYNDAMIANTEQGERRPDSPWFYEFSVVRHGDDDGGKP